MVKKPLTYTLHIIYFLLLIYWICPDVKRSYMHCAKYAKTRTFYDAHFPIFDAALIRENTAMILSIYGKIRLWFCLYTEKYGYDSVYIRKNTATTLSIYGKMRLRLCLYTEKYGYDSVYIRKNTATILSIYGKIGVRESPHFGIFYVRILKKWNFFIRLTSWF